MKKLLAVVLSALLVLSIVPFSSFAVENLQDVIQDQIDAAYESGIKNCKVNVPLKLYETPVTIKVYVDMNTTIEFNGATLETVTGATGVSPLSIKGAGKVTISDLIVTAVYGENGDLNNLRTPAIRVYDMVDLTLVKCNVTGNQRKGLIRSTTAGDAVCMMSSTAKLTVSQSTLTGVNGVDATANGTHPEASVTITDSTVNSAKNSISSLGDLLKKLLNLWLEITKIFIKLLPTQAPANPVLTPVT